MAVSGRKRDDFLGAVSKGSAEDCEAFCEPCLTERQQIEAFRYCVDCNEYLCRSCVRFHQKTKVLKHHKLVDKNDADEHTTTSGTSDACTGGTSDACTDLCSTHRTEVIKFFCPAHEFLGCTDCMTMDHRTCKLDYIPDKCKGVANSQGYRDTMKSIVQKLKEIKDICEKAKAMDEEINLCRDKVICAIAEFRKEINDHLDRLQKKIEDDIKKRMSEDKQNIQRALTDCKEMSSEIKHILVTIEERKSSHENAKLFIALKQTKPKLLSYNIEGMIVSQEHTNMQYEFVRNAQINSILSEEDFGKLSNTGIPLQNRDSSDITIRTKTDRNQCKIIGYAVLSDERVVITDRANSKVKVVDVVKKTVIGEIKLNMKPWDVAVLSNDQVAVTAPDYKLILLISTSAPMKVISTINVNYPCYGIFLNEGDMFVLCHSPIIVRVLDARGNVKSTVVLPDILRGSPYNVAYSPDQRLMYISDCNTHSIASVTLNGEVRATLTDKDLGSPRGMLVLRDGSLLVCSKSSGAVLNLSGDLKERQTFANYLKYPCCIGYNKKQNRVLLFGLNCDVLKIFTV